MESTSGRSLTKDTVDTCLYLLKRAQVEGKTTAKERKAALELAEFLAHYDCGESSDTDDALDEPSRALLASYTDSYWRMYPNGLGASIGHSPSSRQSFYSHGRGESGQEALAAELDKLDSWCEFDVFRVAELSGGRPLETVVLALLERFELVKKLDMDRAKLKSFMREIEAAYMSVPYHNSTHAADVVQSLGCMLANDTFSDQLSDMEMLSMIIAAAVHDVGHPGLSNEFLVNSGAEVALEYNDNSVNENMHAATAFRIFVKPHNNFLEHLPANHFRFFRRTVIAIVLATDMAIHHDLVGDFLAVMRVYGANLGSLRVEQRTRVLQMCVHSSDIANPAKPERFSQPWTDRIMEEFFGQGDLEREKGMPVSPQCDREQVEVATSQIAFLERVVRPCYSALKLLAPTTAGLALGIVDQAVERWSRLGGVREEHHTAAADAGHKPH